MSIFIIIDFNFFNFFSRAFDTLTDLLMEKFLTYIIIETK